MNRRAWMAAGSAIMAGITIAVVQNKVIPCVTVIQQEFEIGLTAFGWLSSIFCVMSIVMAFPAAVITEKLGARATCIASLVCTAAGSLLGLKSDTITLLMASRVLEGAGAGLISIAVPTVISRWFPPEKRGLPTGIWSSWQFVAQALCFFFGVELTEYFGWRGVWWSGILLGAAALLLCLLCLKNPKEGEGYRESAGGDNESKACGRAGEAGGLGGGIATIKMGLKSRSAWMASGAMFCFCFSCFGFVNWAAACWSEQFGIALDTANRYVSLFALISLPVVIGVGLLMDRVDRKKFCTAISFGYIFAVAAAFALPGAGWILPFVILYPFFEGGVSTCLWTVILQTVADSRYVSAAVALFTMASNIGMLTGPPVVGAVVEWSGSWSMGALPVAASMILGTCFSIKIKLY